MAKTTASTFGMAGGIIGLAAIAAYFGLAHGCEQAGPPRVAGRVMLAPAHAASLKPTDVLFVTIKRPGGQGRPLAAKRIERPQFPVSFEITNADVIMQGTELRGMVDVSARLDRDGQAGPAQPGDIEGIYAKNPTLVGGDGIEITLDQPR
ncbi:MAG: hypothetical protein U0172_01545 [Nitrospiraceae bacterium]